MTQMAVRKSLTSPVNNDRDNSPEVAEPFRTAGSVVQISEGRLIFTEGDNSESFYRVVSGVVRVLSLIHI